MNVCVCCGRSIADGLFVCDKCFVEGPNDCVVDRSELTIRRYVIDYGNGVAILYTPYPCEDRFYTLSSVVFGIWRHITAFEVLDERDAPDCEDFERLEFGNIAHIWREDGAKKQIKPEYRADVAWDTAFCHVCKYEF